MILFTDSHIAPHETAVINALFVDGLQALHVRKPDFDIEQMTEFISRIDSRFHDRIMIHSHYELLNCFVLKGLHFSEKTKCQLPEYEHVACMKSMAIHALDELNTVPSSIDYVLLSPLFPSVSKQGYHREWDFAELSAELARKRHFDVVALGGITTENAGLALKLGFHDFALLGTLWEPLKAGCPIDHAIETYRNFKNGEFASVLFEPCRV